MATETFNIKQNCSIPLSLYPRLATFFISRSQDLILGTAVLDTSLNPQLRHVLHKKKKKSKSNANNVKNAFYSPTLIWFKKEFYCHSFKIFFLPRQPRWTKYDWIEKFEYSGPSLYRGSLFLSLSTLEIFFNLILRNLRYNREI